MPNKYVRKRERELRAALKGQNIEALFWWIVREHENPLLDGQKSHLNPGLFRLALDHLSRLQMKRSDQADDKPKTSQNVKELEHILRMVK
jgi:hypothetical protein